MSSLSSQKFSGLGPTTFPLSKFSFATVSGEQVKPIPWTHISDKGHLVAVFENISASQCSGERLEKSQFRILADPEVLEDLDLKALACEASKAVDEMKISPSPPKFPAVTIIIQEPCIAVRFPLLYGQIRRFQVKFKLQSDFYKALALFSQAGCPFTQAGSLVSPIHANRPSTSSFFVASGYPSSGSQGTRPYSTGDSEPRALATSIAASTASSSRPSTSSDGSRRSVRPPSSYSSIQCDASSSQTSEKPHISPSFQRLNSLQPAPNHSVNQGQKPNAAIAESSKDLNSLSLSYPARAIVSAPVSGRDESQWSSLRQALHRPSTAPACDSGNTSHMLPPRRDLPFKLSSTTPAKGVKARNCGTAARVTQEISAATGVSHADSLDQMALPASHRHSDPSQKAPIETGFEAVRGTRTAASRSSARCSSTRGAGTSAQHFKESRLRRRGHNEAHEEANLAEKDTTKGTATSCPPATDHIVDNPNVRDPKSDNLLADAKVDTAAESLPTGQHNNIDTETLLARIDGRQRDARKRKAPDAEASALPFAKHINSDTSFSMAASSLVEGRDCRPRTTVEPGEAGSQDHHRDVADPAAFRTNENAGLPSNSNQNQTALNSSQQAQGRAPATWPGNEFSRTPLDEFSNLARPGGGHHLAKTSLLALLNDPDFAKIPESAQWASLPPEKREVALEAWMCQQLESDSFATLVRDLEGMWQRVFLGL